MAAGGQAQFRDIAPGVIVTLALWLATGILFGRYLAEFASNYVTMYAGLASAMIALVFLYWSATIFVYGGGLNAAILHQRARRHAEEEARRAAEAAQRALRERGVFERTMSWLGYEKRRRLNCIRSSGPRRSGATFQAICEKKNWIFACPGRTGKRLSLHRKPAVDRDRGAGDKIRRRTAEKHRNAGKVLRIAPAAGRRAAEHALMQASTSRRAFLVRSVSIQPGSTAFTWILSFAHAVAQARPNCTMPPLLAA